MDSGSVSSLDRTGAVLPVGRQVDPIYGSFFKNKMQILRQKSIGMGMGGASRACTFRGA
jgi:hypothetical protein